MRRLCTLAEIAFVALATAPAVEAQVTTVMLQGTISAVDGSAPEGVQLEIRSLETNAARRLLADRAGTYRVLGLTPGTYDVLVRAIGYRQQRREGVRLVVGHRATLNFMLDRGAVELEPTIVTAERALEIQRTDISTAVIQEEIEKLPLNTRKSSAS